MPVTIPSLHPDADNRTLGIFEIARDLISYADSPLMEIIIFASQTIFDPALSLAGTDGWDYPKTDEDKVRWTVFKDMYNKG